MCINSPGTCTGHAGLTGLIVIACLLLLQTGRQYAAGNPFPGLDCSPADHMPDADANARYQDVSDIVHMPQPYPLLIRGVRNMRHKVLSYPCIRCRPCLLACKTVCIVCLSAAVPAHLYSNGTARPTESSAGAAGIKARPFGAQHTLALPQGPVSPGRGTAMPVPASAKTCGGGQCGTALGSMGADRWAGMRQPRLGKLGNVCMV